MVYRLAALAWRKLDRRLDLHYIFSVRYERTVGKDHVISLREGISIQLPALTRIRDGRLRREHFTDSLGQKKERPVHLLRRRA